MADALTVKIKYGDFSQHTRSKTIDEYVSKKDEFFPLIKDLLYQKRIEKSVRLLGISITNLFRNELLSNSQYSLQLKFDFNDLE